jgi:hypothetical protein
MLDRNGRIAMIVAAVVVAVAAFLLLSGSDDTETAGTTATATATPPVVPTGATTPEPTETATEEPTPEPEPPILVNSGEVVGGVREIRVSKGETVKFAVASDKPDEVHVHGYDVKKDLKAGAPVEFSFKADIEGIFEIELEGARLQIATLRVEP